MEQRTAVGGVAPGRPSPREQGELCAAAGTADQPWAWR